MAKRQRRCSGEDSQINNSLSRRDFVRCGGMVAAALAAGGDVFAMGYGGPPVDRAAPFRLGLASYTLRNFNRAQVIGFLKQLKVFDLNTKDVKDHLPSSSPEEEAAAVAEYAAVGVRLHAAGTIYFPKDEDADIRSKFEYCKRGGLA